MGNEVRIPLDKIYEWCNCVGGSIGRGRNLKTKKPKKKGEKMGNTEEKKLWLGVLKRLRGKIQEDAGGIKCKHGFYTFNDEKGVVIIPYHSFVFGGVRIKIQENGVLLSVATRFLRKHLASFCFYKEHDEFFVVCKEIISLLKDREREIEKQQEEKRILKSAYAANKAWKWLCC